MKYELDVTDEYGFILYERFISAGTKFPMHWHEFLEFEIIVSGSAEHIYNGNRYIVESGDAYMMCYYGGGFATDKKGCEISTHSDWDYKDERNDSYGLRLRAEVKR